MIAVVTVLAAFALGYFLRSHVAANTAYAIAYLWAFVFQTLYLLLDSLSPNASAPAFEAGEFPLSYGGFTLGVFATGFGLVALGRYVAVRRGRTVPVRQRSKVAFTD